MPTKLQLFFDWQIFFQTISDATSARGARCIAGVPQRRRSATHLHRLMYPRRCRGLTESVTARVVILRLYCERRGRCYVGALETRYYGSGASESVEGEVRRADPLSVNPGQRPGREDEEICTAGRCRCRCGAGECRRRRSAAHVRRCVCPRRCRGLTESVTARAVGLHHYCERR